MSRKFIALFILLLILAAAGCEDVAPEEGDLIYPVATGEEVTVEPTDVVAEAPVLQEEPHMAADSLLSSGVVFSEVLLGVPGNNNQEFIELYNAGETAVDLAGYAIWYRLDQSQEEEQVYAWQGRSEIPPRGHLLLLRDGQEFEVAADHYFDVPLSGRKGGLVLRDGEGHDVALFGWGDAPQGYVAGSGAAVPDAGAGMERLPGGLAGNGQDSGDNSADFVAVSPPNPQNSGSLSTPLDIDNLQVTLDAPAEVMPGEQFEITVTVANRGETTAENIEVGMPTVEQFEVLQGPQEMEQTEDLLTWTIPQLEAGQSVQSVLTWQSPFTYVNAIFRGAYAQAPGWLRDYSSPQLVTMAGGAIPIATARDLLDSTVSVEGIATMYPGGFYAGSGAKFYLQDESGGIQVYAPEAGGALDVQIGDRVRVTGDIELYRDSIELVPGDFNSDVQIVEEDAAEIDAQPITPAQNENDEAVLGRLNQIEGTATRIEEFTYSYEIDLIDEEGNETLVYIDKDSGVTAEPLQVGQKLRITGISEFYSSEKQLMPRLQSDIIRIYPEVLLLEVGTDNHAQPGEILTYVITATNHTADVLTNVLIEAPLPAGSSVDAVSSNGLISVEDVDQGQQVLWQVDEIAPDGGLVVVSFNVLIEEDRIEPLTLQPVTATAEQWPDAVQTAPLLSFMGGMVPIWAIQGPGERSPYVLSERTTEGVVSGAFPELGGFWIQESETDQDPATSAGLFVLYLDGEVDPLPLLEGDLVQVTGLVREMSGQTTLHVRDEAQLVLLEQEQPLPQAVDFDPPREDQAAQVYKESLEGMLVALPGTAVAVAPTTRYGEYVLVNESWDVSSVRRTDEKGFLIMVDDGSQAAHEESATLPYVVKKGDRVSDLVGPLAFTFDQYKIEPLTMPSLESVERDMTALPQAGLNQFSVATFNVENFFDNRDPHPSSPPRPSRSDYENKLDKIAAAIEAMGAPAIIGLQEVENIGVLQDLAERDLLLPYRYEGHLLEGPDPRGIDVAYLVRGDQVTVESVQAFPEPTGLTTRPPLLLKAVVQLDSGAQTIYLLNNHLSSLAGGEEATEPRRTGQAAWNLEIMELVREDDPAARFIVLGDLNSFLQTPPLQVLQDGGLRHAYEFLAAEEQIPYTYIFQGATQSLDHILMSPDLFDMISDVNTLPINADFPLAAAGDPSPQRVSDHDPLLVMFTVEEQ